MGFAISTSSHAVVTDDGSYSVPGMHATCFSASSSKSGAQIQVRSSGLRRHAGTLSYPDRRTRKGKPILGPPDSQADRRQTSTQTGQKATKQSTHAVEGRSYRSEPSFRQARFYDFNVYSNEKRFEKLRYMHRNPVKRGLVSLPELWPWSSFRAYMYAEPSIVKIDELEPRNTKKKPEPK